MVNRSERAACMNDDSVEPGHEPPVTESGNPPDCGPEHRFGPHIASLNYEQGLDVHFTAPRNIMTIRYAFQRGEASFNGSPMRPFVAPPFSLIMHPKDTVIRCRVQRRQAEFVCVTFDDAVFDEHVERAGVKDLTDRSNVLMRHAELPFVALAMRRQILSKDVSAPLFREMLPNLMLAIALNGAQIHEVTAAALSENQIHSALEFIQENLSGNLTIQMVSDHLSMNTTGFAKAFRATLGQSPYQYIFERRLDEARGMLEVTDANLAEIASACGFSSQAHMTSTFTKHLGVTPGRYRRNSQQR